MAINPSTTKQVNEGTPESAPQILGVGLIKEEKTEKVVGIGVILDEPPTEAQIPQVAEKVVAKVRKTIISGWGNGTCSNALNGWKAPNGNN